MYIRLQHGHSWVTSVHDRHVDDTSLLILRNFSLPVLTCHLSNKDVIFRRIKIYKRHTMSVTSAKNCYIEIFFDFYLCGNYFRYQSAAYVVLSTVVIELNSIEFSKFKNIDKKYQRYYRINNNFEIVKNWKWKRKFIFYIGLCI